MTNFDFIKNMAIEEVAKGRIKYCDGSDTHGLLNSYYFGDFDGEIEVEFYQYNLGLSGEDAWKGAYAEALRLEIEWLKSERKEEND